MVRHLIRRLDEPVIFVVGKGGVGKTTTAGAVALGSADAGHRTLLLSTDPAHSLADLFEVEDLGAGPAPSACGTALWLEEFDAAAYLRAWFRESAEALVELIERGTYLKPEQARLLLEPAVPGMDEAMAALRLVDIVSDRGFARVIVDTAPTGHTLRLLSASDTVGTWTAALRAMAAKAGAVAAALARAPIRFGAEAVIDDLDERVTRFRREVLAPAGFLVVSREDPVVRAETLRLREELAARRLRIIAEVRVGEAADRVVGAERPRGADAPGGSRATDVAPASGLPPTVSLPYRPGVRGCDDLRDLLRGPPPSGRRAAAGAEERVGAEGPARAGPPPSLGAGLRLLFFAGKGGVGKSTCAAACALAAAEGREVRLFGIDPAGSLDDVLGVPIPAEGRAVAPRLFVRQVDAAAELDRLRREYRDVATDLFGRMGLSEHAALDRAVMESLWNLAPPGVDELAALARLVELAPGEQGAGTGTEPPLTVIDAAPTGHFLRLLELPDIALEWVHALMRVLFEERQVIGLDGAGESLLSLAKRLRALKLYLADRGTAATCLVTVAEPLVHAETRRLSRRLESAGLGVAFIICNAWQPGKRCEVPAGRLVLAPRLVEPPVGVPALRAFHARWVRGVEVAHD